MLIAIRTGVLFLLAALAWRVLKDRQASAA
jgi:hypothetical protein